MKQSPSAKLIPPFTLSLAPSSFQLTSFPPRGTRAALFLLRVPGNPSPLCRLAAKRTQTGGSLSDGREETCCPSSIFFASRRGNFHTRRDFFAVRRECASQKEWEEWKEKKGSFYGKLGKPSRSQVLQEKLGIDEDNGVGSTTTRRMFVNSWKV